MNDSPRIADAPRPDAAALEALCPTGTLRAGINMSNILLVTDVGPNGEPAGVSPSLAAALAETLGVGLELRPYPGPGELTDAAATDEWDIGNIGANKARAEFIHFTAPYCEIEATYLVRGDAPFQSIDDIDRAGVRIVSKDRAAYTLWLDANIAQAEVVHTASAEESLGRFVAEGIDVLAGLRPQLLSDQQSVPGSRLLPGRYAAVEQAVGTPKSRGTAGIGYLERFVTHAVESGFVASLIEHHGVSGLSVAAR